MSWTDIARAKQTRDRLRFPSDLTDREWAVVAPMIPGPRRGGRPRTTSMRDVVEAILFMASSGCPWRMLPGDFPPVSTVRGYFYAWRDSGLLATINPLLVMAAREIEGRQASPTAGIIDSQKDWEKSIESATTFAYSASIRMLTRRIARYYKYA